MREMLIIVLLSIGLYANSCWNLDKKEWVEFLFLDDTAVNLEFNAVDNELRTMYVYQAEGVTIDYETQNKEYMYYCEYREDIR
jgi:hypothetical protein